MTYRAKQGDPVISEDGKRVVAYWKVDLGLEHESFEWAWHNPYPGELTPPEYDADGRPNNRGRLVLDYSKAGVQVWRVDSLAGQTEFAFLRNPWFEAEPVGDLAVARAIELFMGHEVARHMMEHDRQRLMSFVQHAKRKYERGDA